MLEEKYRAKVEAMQIYVPLLTKLITKLELKNDTSEENVEKISQLKILLQQLLDPKPGISFEELNECHQVMENLFKSNKNDATKLKSQVFPKKEFRNKDTTEIIKIPEKMKIEEKQIIKAENPGPVEKNQQIFLKFSTKSLGNDKDMAQELRKTLKNDIKATERIHRVFENQPITQNSKEIKRNEIISTHKNVKIMELKAKMSENKQISIDIKKDSVEQMETVKEIVNKRDDEVFGGNNNNELENVEIIEFSEEECDENFEDEEMILPDNQEELFVEPRIINFNKNGRNQAEDIQEEEEYEIQLKENHKNNKHLYDKFQLREKYEETERSQQTTNVWDFREQEIYETESHQNKSIYDEVQPYDLMETVEPVQIVNESLENDEILMDFNNSNDSRKSAMKRPTSHSNIPHTLVSKQLKTWDPVNDIEIEAAMETVNALVCNFADPLAVDDLNLEEAKKATVEHILTENTLSTEGYKDDDDEVEIIETRNSPILIDSDGEDVEENNDIAVVPKSTAISTNKTHNQQQQQLQPIRKIVISNVTSLCEKSKNNLITIKTPITKTFLSSYTKSLNNTTQKSQSQKRPNVSATVTSQQQAQSQRSISDLQPKMISGPNPQLFSTKVGNRNLLIPNAFYGTNKKALNSKNPDAAHCRWLENFLRYFCSPYNIAHNTCFLLLQRAMREEDYLNIQQARQVLNVTKGEIDEEMLNSMRKIFYVNGDYEGQKLSFIGRKFCNLAFINILDKTISLTVDWRTNGVTSRTRISAATLEAVRKQRRLTENSKGSSADTVTLKSTESQSVQMPATYFPTAISYPSATTETPNLSFEKANVPVQENLTLNHPTQPIGSTSTPSVIPATLIPTKNSNTSRSNDNDDVEYVPTKKDINLKSIQETSTADKPRRSLRNTNRCDNVETTNILISDEENGFDSNDSNNDVNIQDFLPDKEDSKSSTASNRQIDLGQVDVSALVNDFAPKKLTSTGKLDQEKMTTSFEMAFLERLAHEDKDAFVRAKQATANPTILNKDQTIVVLDDDDDDVEVQTEIAAKLPLEPRLRIDQVDQQDLQKNVDSDVHLKSKRAEFCLICRRKVNHIVGHYVNTHPDCEVYVSRPTPKYAALLMKNQWEIAKYERERNNLSLFIATCVFCEKLGSFTFSYWYQHFASHTGEYAYRCSGCGIRKPSRSHLISHLSSCSKNGIIETTHQSYTSLTKISAYMCSLCHYTQMNSVNVSKHLMYEHGLESIENQSWLNVTLLEIPPEYTRVNANAITDTSVIPEKKTNHKKESKNTSKIQPAISNETKPQIIIRDCNGDIFEIAEVEDGKSYAVDLKANIAPSPFVVIENDEEVPTGNSFYNNQMDVIGDVEGIIQAYINRKT